MAFEREIFVRDTELNKNTIARPPSQTRFVSDEERARRIPSQFNNPDEVIDHGGELNSLDGTHPHTQEEADARDAAYLTEHPRPQTGLVAEVRRTARKVARALRR